jgi:hypothetical protein
MTVAGGVIEDWTSKDSFGHVFSQATSGRRPALLTAEQNGLDVVEFDGVDDFLLQELPGGQPAITTATGGFTIILVLRIPSIGTFDWFGIADTADGNIAIDLFGDSATQGFPLFDISGSGGSLGDVIDFDTWNIMAYTYVLDDSSDATLTELRTNGVLTYSAFPVGTYATTSDPLEIGRRFSDDAYAFPGSLAAFAILPGPPALADLEKAEGKLAHHWDTLATFNPAHPYFDTPP